MKFDMDPDEPDYIEKDGETVENRANRMKSMNREEFKQHIGGVFEKHLNWRARHAKVSTTIGNLLPQYEQLLQEITDDVFNNPEYQRGIANYHTVYTDAWDMYLDAVGEGGNTSDPMYNHISRLPKAPGAYSNGQLLSIPEMYKGRRRAARTEYAKRWLRAKVGVEADPARAYARKKAEEMRIGYGRAWRHNIWKRLLKENQAVPTDEEVEAELEKLIQNRLGKNLTEAYLRPDLPPPPRTPEKEVRRRGRSMEGNIDTRDRTKAGRMMNEEYGTSARSEKEMNKQYTFTERTRGNPDAGFPKIVEFFKQGKKVRNEYVVQPERGALVIDSDPENPAESVIRLIDYRKADAMLANLSDPMNVYYAPLKAKGGIYSPEMKNEVFARSPVKGRESDYYTTDNMMILYTRIYPKLEEITSVLQGLSLGPSDFANLKSWDKANGAKIAPNITSDNFDLWQNVILTYCKNYDIPDAKTSADRGRAIFKKLGIIPGVDAGPPPIDPDSLPVGVSVSFAEAVRDGRMDSVISVSTAEARYYMDQPDSVRMGGYVDLSGVAVIPPDVIPIIFVKDTQMLLLGVTELTEELAKAIRDKEGSWNYVNLTKLQKPLTADTIVVLDAKGAVTLSNVALNNLAIKGRLNGKNGPDIEIRSSDIDVDTMADAVEGYEGKVVLYESDWEKATTNIRGDFSKLLPNGNLEIDSGTNLDADTMERLKKFKGNLTLRVADANSADFISRIADFGAASLNVDIENLSAEVITALNAYSTKKGEANLEVHVTGIPEGVEKLKAGTLSVGTDSLDNLNKLAEFTGELNLHCHNNVQSTAEFDNIMTLITNGKFTKIFVYAWGRESTEIKEYATVQLTALKTTDPVRYSKLYQTFVDIA